MDDTFKQVITLLQNYDKQWAVCGGWAIDLFLNRQTRHHKDLDITIHRHHQNYFQSFLLAHGWTLKKVIGSELQEWEQDDYLELPVHNIWCSHPDFPPYYLEVLFSETTATHYHFRRNQQIQISLDEAFLLSESNLPILAPEIVLLFKAKYRDEIPAYQQDFELTQPELNGTQRQWLKHAIMDTYGIHSWTEML